MISELIAVQILLICLGTSTGQLYPQCVQKAATCMKAKESIDAYERIKTCTEKVAK